MIFCNEFSYLETLKIPSELYSYENTLILLKIYKNKA